MARQARSGWLALWIASTVAITATLAMAAPASGQATPAAADAQPTEVLPEPIPVEAPEVAVAAEEPTEAAPPPASAPANPQPVSGLVAKTVEDTSEAVTKTQVAEELPGPAAQVAKRATELSDEARASEIVAAAEKAVLPALPLPDEAPAGTAAPAPDQPLPLHQAPVGKELLAGAWLGHVANSPGGLPANHATAGAAATDLPHVGAPGSLSELKGALPYSATGVFTGAVHHFNQPASPPDSPGFPSSLTTEFGASGSGATFFVPIAALLALLALASPAILRRLRELPDFPAPTPFVCALERPG